MNDTNLEKLVVDINDILTNRFFGKYRGIVHEVIEDKKKGFGLVTAIIPEVFNDKPSPPAWPSVSFAGNKSGIWMPPKKGDLIYVEFEAGDPNKPVWTGFWWAENEMPEDANSNTIVLISRNGNKVVLDDENDEIKFVHSTGSELSMTSNEIVFRIEKTKMVISKQGISVNDGAFEVKTTG